MAVLTAKLAISRKKIADEQLSNEARNLVRRLLAKQIPKSKIGNLMNFLRYYVRFEKQETFDKFVKEIEVLTEKRATMGVEEFLLDRAKKEGIELGAKRVNQTHALKMMENGIDINMVSNITGLSVKEIKALVKNSPSDNL